VDRRLKWNAAVYAGLVAGVLATLIELALWAVFTEALPLIFFRDARFAAAIVMGRKVLDAGFDWRVMSVATLVHFTLSVSYGLILSWLIRYLPMRSSLIVGATFGVVLYVLNMYGFTIVFPWFEAARDWITLGAHLAFGVIAAGAYRALSK
jgi:hypothetical protein